MPVAQAGGDDQIRQLAAHRLIARYAERLLGRRVELDDLPS